MRGPSSSHCAAALRIGRLARDLMDGDIAEVLVEFDRAGSLPTTHESQGSDMGLCGGLLEWEADGEKIVVRRAGRYTSEEIHRALFPVTPERRDLKELKEGIRKYTQDRHEGR